MYNVTVCDLLRLVCVCCALCCCLIAPLGMSTLIELYWMEMKKSFGKTIIFANHQLLDTLALLGSIAACSAKQQPQDEATTMLS